MGAPSVVGIWNRALQLLGASSVQNITDTTKNAQECAKCYDPIRQSVLSAHPWRFALSISDALPADDPVPAWGRANSFTLPDDFLNLAPDYPEDNTLEIDFEIQEGRIYTDNDAPLYIRYIADVTDPARMPGYFRELLAHEMALAMCEAITQSNSKKQSLATVELPRAWSTARRANSRQVRPQEPPDDPFLLARL